MAVERTPSTQVRQGDVLLTPQLGLPPEEISRILRDGRNLMKDTGGEAVLAVGVGGGHPHKVVGETVQFVETSARGVLRQQPDDQVSRVIWTGEKPATVTHDEHEAIELPAQAFYVVFRQLETLVGDDNELKAGAATGVIANDSKAKRAPSRRYVQD